MTNTVAIIVTGVSWVVRVWVAKNILLGRLIVPSRAAHECAHRLFPRQFLVELDLNPAVNHTPC